MSKSSGGGASGSGGRSSSKVVLDNSKDSAIVNAIANKISSIPADKKADHGTLHSILGYSKRKSEALLMASYAVQRLYGIKDTIVTKDSTAQQRAYHKQVSDLADEALKQAK
jgi:hypothetical protein